MSESQASLPPGTAGLPLLGETLALLRDPFGFVETRARRPGPALDALRADYAVVLRGFGGLPIPLPWTAYGQARAAIRRVLRFFRQQIREHATTAPGTATDGLSRIVAARGADGQPALDAD